MDAETFQKLDPEIHRLLRLILNGEATEVQINFVLKTNNLDRKTLDDAIDFIENMGTTFNRLSFFFVLLVLLIINLFFLLVF